MKTFLLLLMIPLNLLAQPFGQNGKDITGTWQGFVSTSEKKIPYELVISLKDGSLVAYSLTSFTVNNEEIISLKKVNLRFKEDEIVAEDDDIVFDNITNEAAKKIKQTNKLKLNDEGERWTLTGTFETKSQRVLRPAKGEVFLEKAANPNDTRLMAKLEEMNMAAGLTFTPVQVATKVTTPPVPVDIVAKPPVPKETVAIPPAVVVAVLIEETPVPIPPLTFKEQLRLTENIQKKSIATVTKPAKTRIYIAPVPSITRSAPMVVASIPAVKPAAPVAVAATEEPSVSPTSTPARKPLPANVVVAPALDLAKRKIETIGQVFIEADSLMLTLYDNGEVDGDSVSLVLNGKTIVSKQGLSTTAFTKTIYITPDMGDSIQLVMYAENLGSLPPNTGLLILQFDNQRQEIRFSGDLDKNAAITLRRREKR